MGIRAEVWLFVWICLFSTWAVICTHRAHDYPDRYGFKYVVKREDGDVFNVIDEDGLITAVKVSLYEVVDSVNKIKIVIDSGKEYILAIKGIPASLAKNLVQDFVDRVEEWTDGVKDGLVRLMSFIGGSADVIERVSNGMSSRISNWLTDNGAGGLFSPRELRDYLRGKIQTSFAFASLVEGVERFKLGIDLISANMVKSMQIEGWRVKDEDIWESTKNINGRIINLRAFIRHGRNAAEYDVLCMMFARAVENDDSPQVADMLRHMTNISPTTQILDTTAVYSVAHRGLPVVPALAIRWKEGRNAHSPLLEPG